MRTRRLGAAGPELTELGLGSWAMGGPGRTGWGPQDDRESIAAIRAALDRGVNWIDTAAVYGWGHSEEVVGQAIAGQREVLVATKCGLVPGEGGAPRRDLSPASIREELEASLRRLRRDTIDLYMIHWPALGGLIEPTEAGWATLVDLRREGKIRWAAVSNWSLELAERCEPIGHIDAVENPLSLVNRTTESDVLPWAAAHGVGFLAYSPMNSGLLTGSFELSRLDPGDWRRGAPWTKEPDLSLHLALVEGLRPMAQRLGVSSGRLAVAWVLRHADVTAAIIGARSTRQVGEDLGAADVSFSDGDIMEIEAALAEHDNALMAAGQP